MDVLCDGVEGRYDVSCMYTLIPIAVPVQQSSSTLSTFCDVQSFSPQSSTFHCNMRENDSSRAGTPAEVQVTTVSFNQSHTSVDFIATYRSVYALSLKVVVVFSSIWFIWMLAFLVGLKVDQLKHGKKADKKKSTRVGVAEDAIDNTFSGSRPISRGEDSSSSDPAEPPVLDPRVVQPLVTERLRTLLSGSYLASVFPAQRTFQNMMLFIDGNDDYLEIIFGDDGSVRKGYQVLRAITHTTILCCVMLFISIYLYGADNQTNCWELRTEEDCNLSVPDSFEFFSRDCVWEASSDKALPSCVLTEPEITLTTTILLAVIGEWLTVLFPVCIYFQKHICNMYINCLLYSIVFPFFNTLSNNIS